MEKPTILSDEQTCKICGVADGLNFHIPDGDWEAIVNPELKQRVLCLKCFDKMATNAQRSYTITEICFAGIKQAFFFLPESMVQQVRQETARELFEALEKREATLGCSCGCWQALKAKYIK